MAFGKQGAGTGSMGAVLGSAKVTPPGPVSLSSATGVQNGNGSITFSGDDVLFADAPFRADVLIVGAGAGGGTSGGPGGGRVRYLRNVLLGKQNAIKIGRGGAGATSNGQSTRGGDSWVWPVGRDPYISSGGSPTGIINANAPQWLGGSGAGAGTDSSAGPYLGGPGEGLGGSNPGGNNLNASSPFGGGGGGGAGTAGQNQQARNIPGNGGDGLSVPITGSAVYYGGGGPGSCFSITGGGFTAQSATGGLGNAITSPATAVDGPQGIDGVGGGGSAAFAANTGGRGGDGVVIVLPLGVPTYSANSIRPTASAIVLPITANLAAFYSIYKLTGWAGSCMQVVRASDSTTLDIGFVNNVADFAAADAFAQAARTSWTIAKIYDQSGNGNNLTTSKSAALTLPTGDVLNAQQGGVRPFTFDSIGNTQNQLASNATITGNTNAVTVYQVVTPRTSLDYQGYWQLTDVTNNSAFYSNLYHNQQTDLRWQANGLALIGTGIYERGIPQAMSVSSSGTTGQIVRANGTEFTSASNTTSQTFAGLRIGCAYNGTGQLFGIFDLFGFALYNAAHTSVQMQSVEAALTAPITVPSGFTKRLVYGGNSLVTGQLSTFNQQPFWQAGFGKGSEGNLSQWEPILMGVAGRSLASENSTMRTIYAGLYDGTKICKITISDPTNDVTGMTFTSQADAEAQADTFFFTGTTLPFVAYLQGLGYQVVVPTMIARAADTIANFKEYFRLRYNAQAIANAAGNGYTVSDRAKATTAPPNAFNTPAAASDLTRFGDGTHCLNYGYNSFALTDRFAIAGV